MNITLRQIQSQRSVKCGRTRDRGKERTITLISGVPQRLWVVSSYYSPTREESVEMEEALKAGHVLEPDRDMQFCAEVIEVDNASSVNRSDFCIVDLFVCI